MTTILIAVDGTDASIHAAGRARALFGPEAEYLAINVADRMPPAMVDTVGAPSTWGAVWPYEPDRSALDDVEAVARDENRRAISDAERMAVVAAHEAGIEPDQVIGDVGDPATAILAAAHDHGADVIVIGSHERTWFSRLFNRSVSTELARHADVPILIAR